MWSSQPRLLGRGLSQVRNAAAAAGIRRPCATSPSTSAEQRSGLSPLDVSDYFGVHKLFKLEDLFSSRVHLGHVSRALHPNMRPFVYGSRFGQDIIDLDQTALHLRQVSKPDPMPGSIEFHFAPHFSGFKLHGSHRVPGRDHSLRGASTRNHSHGRGGRHRGRRICPLPVRVAGRQAMPSRKFLIHRVGF